MAEQKQSATSKGTWKTTTKRYVGFIDIMGFKDRVSRSTHEEIYNMMLRLNKSKKSIEKIKWAGRSGLIRTTTYSDSIMFYTKNDSVDSLFSLIAMLSAFSYDLFEETIPFKGAVAHGLMTLDDTNSIFFGQPLIDAFLLQEEIYFYGIVLHSSVEEKIDSMKGVKKKNYTVNYLCPFKKSNAKHKTIFPMYIDYKDLNVLQDILTNLHKLRYNTSGYLRKYIDNTEAYLEYVEKTVEINKPLPSTDTVK